MSGSEVDLAFEGAGQVEGLTLWRIEDKVVVKQPKVDGKFHTGDSYILLSTTEVGNKLSWAIHFWLGTETSQDEKGIAAYKTVELDEYLGGGAVEFREVQEHESARFLSYFKSTGLEYRPGGVASGFVTVEADQYRTRLLLVKGKRIVRISEVPCSAESLTTGDAFILDAGLELYMWSGPETNLYEKSKAVEMISQIKNSERGGRASVTIVNEDPQNAAFWELLGGYMEVTAEGEADDLYERVSGDAIMLYQVSEAVATPVETSEDGKLTKDMLDTGNVYLLDTGSEIFSWVGKESSPEEKKEWMGVVKQHIADNGLDPSTPVVRVMEGYETASFKGYFYQWTPPIMPSWNNVTSSSEIAPSREDETDTMALAQGMQNDAGPTDEHKVDDGSGKLEIWRVENFALAPWPEENYGELYGGDSYVMLYTYFVGDKEMYLIYFWQGRDTSSDEKGASAILAKEMDDGLNGAATQVRVAQGKEPKHMRSLFGGRLVVHMGGEASGFNNSEEKNSYDVDGVSLYHVKGTQPDNTYGMQVREVASNLNSGDCFVLMTPAMGYVWVGRHCSSEESTVAESIAEMLTSHHPVEGRTVSTVREGEESEEFWAALGGQADYPDSVPGPAAVQEPRLFQVSNVTGVLSVEPVYNFDQTDLCVDDIMLLDTYVTVYIWVGTSSNKTEQEEAMLVAQQYISTATDGRHLDTPIVRVTAGNEPTLFTQHFLAWDPELLDKNIFVDPYEAKLAAAREEEARIEAEREDAPGTVTMESMGLAQGEVEVEVAVEEPEVEVEPEARAPEEEAAPTGGSRFVAYADLMGAGREVEGVDPSCREQYLSDTEFFEVFGMSKADFLAQPKWKQQSQKKAKSLF